MSHSPHTEHGSGGYEKKDVNVKAVLLVAAVIVVVIVISVLGVNQFVIYEKEKSAYEIRLKPDNPQLLELQAHEDSVLTSYKLLDTVKGYYQIPIDQAMDRVAKEAKDNQQTPVSGGGSTR
jgi:hypothetical protein